MEHEIKRDVLIVDDDKAIRSLWCAAMTRRGLGCDTATDGADALRQIDITTYAVVLLDFTMPNVDGPEFLRQLAKWQLSATRRPIVLLMTAFGQDRVTVLAETVHAIILKPFDLNDVVELVRNCVEERRIRETSDLSKLPS